MEKTNENTEKAENFPLAFIVCVEDAGYGKTVCIPIASQVLQAIVNATK